MTDEVEKLKTELKLQLSDRKSTQLQAVLLDFLGWMCEKKNYNGGEAVTAIARVLGDVAASTKPADIEAGDWLQSVYKVVGREYLDVLLGKKEG